MIAVLINTEAAAATAVAADIARAAFEVSEAPLHDLPAPSSELAAIAGTFESDEGPVDLTPCGARLCFNLPDVTAERRALKREAPFVYAIDRDTMVRFVRRRGRVDWTFAYTAGLMTDAKRRTR
ncbi:hypothetical protein LuPra_01501 [Luteitalea pratensis]|uniref:Uncharacterized protein n=1 Tax=Luteitalea pratensis TaxID=1855912 RepID=A0A143PIC7_LUTPR|nr:hypothetical protein [Luteitalea pratensis]AMY08307.1 hypothetical protein LuPra_01501 [Luteitalea pratensis]